MDEDRDPLAILFEKCAWFSLGFILGVLLFIFIFLLGKL
jgi:hypothetical protein